MKGGNKSFLRLQQTLACLLEDQVETTVLPFWHLEDVPPIKSDLFGCWVDGSRGEDVRDLRAGVGRRDGLWCGLSGGAAEPVQSGVALRSRGHLTAADTHITCIEN